LLIFDEVITGFRIAPGGAQGLYGVTPDLTCLGKILGGGLPLAAFGGRAEVMDFLAPEGPVYQAGTLSGNPLAVAAGLATLEALADTHAYDALEERAEALQEAFATVIRKRVVPAAINRVGPMLTMFFGIDEVGDAQAARRCSRDLYAQFFHWMLNHGVYWPPSQFEAAFVSLAHDASDIDQTVAAFAGWAEAQGGV
jgi:glutamate-1-semialdehyde 2,1-aminomutase